MKIKDKCAVVTGGAKGIGLATVKRLLDSGCVVTVWDMDEDALKDVKKELADYKGRVFFSTCDVTDPKRVYTLAKKAKRDMSRVDILVNNAGIVIPGDFLDVADEAHRKVIDVNVNSMIYTIKAFLPNMYEENFGVIVNISSAAGTQGVANQAMYAASKWAVWGLSESLRHEAANRNKKVHIASVHPGYLATGLFEGASMSGFGALLVPLVKDHDVIAKGIVEHAIKRRKNIVFRPRSIRLAPLLRGLLPDKVFFKMMRVLNIHKSMNNFKGRTNG